MATKILVESVELNEDETTATIRVKPGLTLVINGASDDFYGEGELTQTGELSASFGSGVQLGKPIRIGDGQGNEVKFNPTSNICRYQMERGVHCDAFMTVVRRFVTGSEMEAAVYI